MRRMTFSRLFSTFLALILLLTMPACGGKPAATWQEQYDLGIRYLSEGNYKEAVLAFTAAIDIDPRQADAYVKLAETYTAQGDKTKAVEMLTQALSAVGENEAVSAALAALGVTTGAGVTTPDDSSNATESGAPSSWSNEIVRSDRMDFPADDPDLLNLYTIRDYNAFDDLVRITSYLKDGSYIVSEFDEYHREISSHSYTPDGTICSYITYAYSENTATISHWEILFDGSHDQFSIDYTMSQPKNSVELYDWSPFTHAVVIQEFDTEHNSVAHRTINY